MHRRADCRAIGFLDECTNRSQGPEALPSFRVPVVRGPVTLQVSLLAASVLPGSGHRLACYMAAADRARC